MIIKTVLCPREKKYVYVDVQSWYSGYPGIYVNEGELYSFKVNPLYKWNTKWMRYNAKGAGMLKSFFYKPRNRKAPYHSLCATVDRNEEMSFAIGLKSEVQETKASGDLVFYCNKNISEFNQGDGHIIVEVERVA